MITALLSRLIILSFGTLYPAYASYKAVRTKDVNAYVKWMMYWIVFAFFNFTETFTDVFLSWFPAYYEFKIVFLLWLLLPATKGSSTLYKKYIHPMLTRHEQEIDEHLNQVHERGYSAVLQLGSMGVSYATNAIMQTGLIEKVLTTLASGQKAVEPNASNAVAKINEKNVTSKININLNVDNNLERKMIMDSNNLE